MVTPARSPLPRCSPWLFTGLGLSGVGLLLCMAASLVFGAVDIPLATVLQALFDTDETPTALIIRTVRLPRTLIATLVGAALAVAGALIQGVTRNPLADASILGIEAGAALAVVTAIFLFDAASPTPYLWWAFLGAALAAIAVYGLGSLGRTGLTPLKLTVAGAALAALLSSMTTGILILSQRTLEEIRFWLAGAIAGRDLAILAAVLPYLGLGLVLALSLGRQLTLLNLGEDVAQGLGLRTTGVKLLAGVGVLLLAGSAVAIAGPIGFVGLVVPHLVRFWVGLDYRWILPYSAIYGGGLLLVADIAARLVLRPQELPVGVMTALVGAPFFIYLARWQVKA